MGKHISRWLVTVLPLTFFVAALGYCLSAKSRALFVFINFSYSLFFILLCLWAVCTALFIKEADVLKWLKENRVGILVAFCLTALCFFFIDAWFRLLSDETNLVAVSQSMALQKKVYLTKMGRLVNNDLLPLVYTTPKRPLLFSFGLSLVHNVFGYRFENAFMVNLGGLFVLLCLVFTTVRKMAGSIVAIAAQVLVLSQPVIPLHATSAGFDLFSAFFFGLSLFAAHQLMQKKDARAFAFLWTTLLMFANIRYESFIFMVLITAFLAATRYLGKELLLKNAFVLAMTPLVFLPRILQTWISTKGLVENPEGVPSFSLHHFADNVRILADSLFDFGRLLPYATVLNLVSLILLAAIAGILAMGGWQKLKLTHRHMLILAVLGLAGMLMIFLPYYMGNCAHPSTVRFFLVPVLFLSLVPALYAAFRPGSVTRLAVCALALISFWLYFPVAVENRFLNAQFGPPELKQAYTFLEKQNTATALVISATPSRFIPLGYSAVDFKTANANLPGIKQDLAKRVYDSVFVFQALSRKTDRVRPEHFLNLLFNLKTVGRFNSTEGSVIRISEANIK